MNHRNCSNAWDSAPCKKVSARTFQPRFSDELPVHSVYVSAFYMGRYEVIKGLWDEVRAWGLNHGYTVHSISWFAVVKWCNARSDKENLTPCYTVGGVTYKTGSSAPVCNWNADGYRLLSEAEWEKAARGGLRISD